MTKQKRVVHLTFDRTTKGAIKLQEIDIDGNLLHMFHPNTCIGSLYIRKQALHGVIPRKVKVTIEYDDDNNNR